MTAVVILNIVFAAFVLVGMLSLLGRAVVTDRRATRPYSGASRVVPAVRPRFGGPSARSAQRLNPAA